MTNFFQFFYARKIDVLGLIEREDQECVGGNLAPEIRRYVTGVPAAAAAANGSRWLTLQPMRPRSMPRLLAGLLAAIFFFCRHNTRRRHVKPKLQNQRLRHKHKKRAQRINACVERKIN